MSELDIMKHEITSKIKKDMNGVHVIQLKYIDIKLLIWLITENNKFIFSIRTFQRGGFVKDNPKYSIGVGVPKKGEPVSNKGDGSLFLSLVVIHCNNLFHDKDIIWEADWLSDWWSIKGVCAIENACEITEDGKNVINNEKFLQWAQGIVVQHESRHEAEAAALPEVPAAGGAEEPAAESTGGTIKRKKSTKRRKPLKRKSTKRRKSNKKKSTNKRKSNKRKSNKKI